MRRLLFELSMAGVVVIWGVNYANVKFGTVVWNAVDFTWLRFLIVTLILVAFARVRKMAWPKAGEIPSYLFLGIVGVALYQTTFVGSAHFTTAGATALLIAMAPVYAGLYGALAGRERPSAPMWAGIGLCFAGVAAMALWTPRFGTAPDPLRGDLLGLLAGLLWAAYTWVSGPVLAGKSPWEVTAWTSLAGLLGLTFALPWTGLPSLHGVPAASWWDLLYAVGPVTLFGLVAWQAGVKEIGATSVLVYLYAEPLVGALSGHVLLGEPITLTEIAGGAAILLGVTLARLKPAGRVDGPAGGPPAGRSRRAVQGASRAVPAGAPRRTR